MQPVIKVKETTPTEMAKEIYKCCPLKVFDLTKKNKKVLDIEDIKETDTVKLTATRTRDCTFCRECIRDENREK